MTCPAYLSSLLFARQKASGDSGILTVNSSVVVVGLLCLIELSTPQAMQLKLIQTSLSLMALLLTDKDGSRLLYPPRTTTS